MKAALGWVARNKQGAEVDGRVAARTWEGLWCQTEESGDFIPVVFKLYFPESWGPAEGS